MKIKIKNLIQGGLVSVVSVLIIFNVAKAGDITPPGGTPTAQFYTLSEIYEFIVNNTAATEGGHDFTFSDSLAGAHHTLTEIYDALAGLISADKVKLGTTYLNVAGTLTPDGGTAAAADLFNNKTAHLTSDWNLDTGTLNLACNTAVFDGTGNLAADAYDGGGDGFNRWCVTDTGDAVAGEILSGKKVWVDGVEITGSLATQTLSDSSETVSAGNYAATTLSTVDADLASSNIKSGATIFGVAGDYPSATYPLSGDTGATDAAATEICNTNEAWTKAGVLLTGTLNPTAATIGAGNTYCGVAGSLLKELYNGSATSGDYPQNVGGVDDYNNGGSRPSDSYAGSWTTCDAGNSYCQTSDATNADKKDDSADLVWSKWLDSGTTHTWFWANNCEYPNGLGDGTCDTNGEAACKCVKKTSAETGCEAVGDGNWRLPYQKELMQAYINGSWGNLSSAGNYYWSATTKSNNTHNAWVTGLNSGYTNTTTKTNAASYRVRCVR